MAFEAEYQRKRITLTRKGKAVGERAQALISIVHPEFRERRERAARAHDILPKDFI